VRERAPGAGPSHRVGVYYAWSRPDETGAPLEVIENRFPTLFESRRMRYPEYVELADPDHYDQGIAGFLDVILRHNFSAFVREAGTRTGLPVVEIERIDRHDALTPIGPGLTSRLDTLVVIGFDSTRTGQHADEAELAALREFLDTPGNLLFVAPHHDIGDAPEQEFFHHGDRTIPPEQRFGGYTRSVLAGLGVPVENRFGLHPAADPDGTPAQLEIDRASDRLGLLDGVTTFNLHPHLPHFERLAAAIEQLDVLARQRIDPAAPPHPFSADGRLSFDALLQSRPEVFAGTLLVGDATLYSSTAGGLRSLRRLWANLVTRATP
jgi:hypothetical protein